MQTGGVASDSLPQFNCSSHSSSPASSLMTESRSKGGNRLPRLSTCLCNDIQVYQRLPL